MSEVANNNIESNSPFQENFGLMEAITANIKKVAALVKQGIEKVLNLSIDTSKQFLDWAIPESPVKDIAKSMIEEKPIPKSSPQPPANSVPTATPDPNTQEQAA